MQTTTCSKCSGRGRVNFTNLDAGKCYACGGCGKVSAVEVSLAAPMARVEKLYRAARLDRSSVALGEVYAALDDAQRSPRFDGAYQAFLALGFDGLRGMW